MSVTEVTELIKHRRLHHNSAVFFCFLYQKIPYLCKKILFYAPLKTHCTTTIFVQNKINSDHAYFAQQHRFSAHQKIKIQQSLIFVKIKKFHFLKLSNMNSISLQMRLDSLTLNLPNLKKWLGKEVILTVIELPKTVQVQKTKNWQMLGAIVFPQNLDQTNIRDLAYED